MKRVATPEETALYVKALSQMEEQGVAILGWGDPEHVTSASGGVVLCTFSAANLAFWHRLGVHRREAPVPLPRREGERALRNKTYLVFETNEGDTPRILTSAFNGAWGAPVPVNWAVDPLLGEMLPALWNVFATSAAVSDTCVDGAGYVFLHSLGKHATAYEKQAGKLAASGLGSRVIDVGVADERWPAVTVDELEAYVRNAKAGGRGPDLLINGTRAAPIMASQSTLRSRMGHRFSIRSAVAPLGANPRATTSIIIAAPSILPTRPET